MYLWQSQLKFNSQSENNITYVKSMHQLMVKLFYWLQVRLTGPSKPSDYRRKSWIKVCSCCSDEESSTDKSLTSKASFRQESWIFY